MPRTHDEEREHRIIYEVIVDCYDDEEELIGWFYYFADNLEFPMEATVKFRLRDGGEELKKVKIMEIDPKSENGKSLRLGIVEGSDQRVHYISPEEIVSLNSSESNAQIINDWLYWHNFNLISA